MELPKILDIPRKLLKMVLEFNLFRFFCLEGGRGSAKSHSVARFLLYLGERYKLRIVCGREIQGSIEESVYQLMVDIIIEFNLNYAITKTQLTHRVSGSTVRFKGLREQGIVNIKSLEGCDILWIEEAQSITEATLKIIIPTIRKNNAKIFFTMNRFIRTDPVYTFCQNRSQALIIHIDYFENEFCPENLIVEAKECEAEDIAEYRHIWLGQPKKSTEEYVFDFDKIADMETIVAHGDLIVPQSILSIDFASGGGDLCVASLLRRISMTQWDLEYQEEWDEFDTTISVGKSVSLYGRFNPDGMIVDASGLGHPMFCDIVKLVPKCVGFLGGETGKNTKRAKYTSANHRAEGYLEFAEWVNKGWLRCRAKKVKANMETLKKEFRPDGTIIIEPKKKARSRGVKSQDHSDSVMMGIFYAKHYLGKQDFNSTPPTPANPSGSNMPKRLNSRKRI